MCRASATYFMSEMSDDVPVGPLETSSPTQNQRDG